MCFFMFMLQKQILITNLQNYCDPLVICTNYKIILLYGIFVTVNNNNYYNIHNLNVFM